ncbi:MAG: segregation and condensation protein A [Thermoflexales bacterium]
MTEPFALRLPNYEGPLDVLLRLIEERKLDITEVSLALVADQFIAYLASLSERDLSQIAHFIVVAAKLLVLKSRVLLPTTRPTTQADTEEEMADDLVRQLREYRAYKRAAEWLRRREARGLRAFPVPPPPLPRPQPRANALAGVTLPQLVQAMQRVVMRWMPPPPADTVIAPLPFSMQECMDRIQRAARSLSRVTFSSLLSVRASRAEVAISLLALLELLRRFHVRCYQEQLFGEIVIEYLPEEERPVAEYDTGDVEPAV